VRVLFSSLGALGHVYPMLPLARALRADGHEVRWACGAEMSPVINQAGIPTVPTAITDRTIEEGRRRVGRRQRQLATLSPEQRTDYLFSWMFGELLAPPMLRDLLPVVRSWRPHLVVHDQYEFAGPIAAAAIGAAHVTHSLGPMTPEHRVSSASERVSALWEEAGCDPRPYGGFYDHLYIDIYPPSIQPVRGEHVGRRQLLRPAPYPPPDGGARLPAGLDINGDRPLIYVTFGTQLTGDRPLQFLIDVISSLEVRMLVTVGAHRNPASFGTQPPGVVIERFVPQAAVLPHADVVVSHAGSGTVLAALGAGLPQLCFPQNDDQPLNARAVSDGGAGLACEIDAVDAPEVVQAMRRLLSEPQFAEGAERVAAEIADMPTTDKVALALREFG
jgi:UDP:flavonoid glycosyltransferase YjiC (YdhE family)